MQRRIYSLPRFYDIAFSWDVTSEVEFFISLFKKHVPFEVRHILEPACGTGRFLRSFPRYGYRITGYDRSQRMVAYAKRKVAESGYQNDARVFLDDMVSANYPGAFDAAINSINSIGYLWSDKDVVSHFVNTGDSLKKNGIYIVHLSCAYDSGLPEAESGDSWSLERDGIHVKTTWRSEKDDPKTKRSHQICLMEIDDHGRKIHLEDRHTLRLWFFDDLKKLIHDSEKFELDTVYDENYQELSEGTRISGELGNLYFVLRAL